MLKSGSNFIRMLFYGRSHHKIRTDSYWTDSYPSPEPSWLRKTANTTSDWIYNHIDNFFRGSANKYKAEFTGNLSNTTIISTSYKEWELNQDIVDIAFKDIKSSLNWILPGFIRKFAFRLHQLALLYLFTDVVNDEESSEWIDSNCLSINNWWKKFISWLRVFLRLNPAFSFHKRI